MTDQMRDALETIAAYPSSRDQEMGVAAMRKIAREALASAQQADHIGDVNEMVAEPMVPEDVIDAVSKALRKAWQLGQTYWQQADHEFASYHRKADETQAKFDALVDETRALFAACRACRGGVEAEPAAKAIHYPTCWDTAAYPTIGDALAAVYHHFKCSECAPPAVPAEWREVMRAIADFEPIVMTSSSYGGSVFRVELGFRNLVDRNKGHDFLLKLIHFRDLLAGTKQSGGEG